MNAWGRLYFAALRARGSRVPQYYREYVEADPRVTAATQREALAAILEHCRDEVPFHAPLLRGRDPRGDPLGVLRSLPVLTKATVRERFDELKCRGLERRAWFVNTSGGSTGEPARFVQDREFDERTVALALAFSRWVGHEVGEPEVRLWGSERDVIAGAESWRKRLGNALRRTTYLNAFRMTPASMRHFAEVLRRRRPTLVVAYAQALYELAGFLEEEGRRVPPPRAVVTSAGTLHGFMRERIGRVFGCPVYDRYGSREVGLIAGERPGVAGRWVPPWSVFVEVVDERGHPAAAGQEGEILVTSLVNRAMPLVRYRIGDRGVLGAGAPHGAQVLARVLGRSVDAFRRRDGTLVDGEFFTHLVYFRTWVEKFQFVQKDYDRVVLRVVSPVRDRAAVQPDLDEMRAHARAALGDATVLDVEWVDEIPAASSGKYRYTISEVAPP